ncbi:hypothetical protein [Helicobacter sp. 11S03491-1]|uniref:hypothetical protein n=1 Tax=Helicobacter sp. 11S03491-1 TaxID=1476196 RepID=UPI000BA6E37E|nr:hypothetical protein [Helicobacter sp. 11S03491-1]PAF41478.1 hypothetical protein BKH45_07095 [Helicobacter sp. 11S03491-1]
MKKILWMLIISVLLAQGAIIKKIEVFNRKDGVDLLLFSDKKFSSNPQEFKIEGNKIIVLKDTYLKQKWEKKINSSLLESLEIFSNKKDIYIIPKSSKSFKIQAAKSRDGYTLRLRFLPIQTIDNVKSLITQPTLIKSSPINLSKNSSPIPQDYQYWIVLAVMAILILVLLILRKKINPNTLKKTTLIPTSSLHILSTKNIDNHNKLVLFQIKNYGYILLLNNKQNLLVGEINLETTGERTKIDDDFWNTIKKSNQSLNH